MKRKKERKRGSALCRTVIVAGAWACLVSTWGCGRKTALPVPSAPCESPAILAQFRLHYPVLIGVSADGERVLVRDKSGTRGDGLIVRDVETGKILHAMQSDEPVVRVTWRPDGRAISYFRQEAGTNRRRLFMWELESDRHREIAIPESFAQKFVKWSPDGKYLAFTRDSDGLAIVEPDGGRVSYYSEPLAAFDWSADSGRIAVMPEEQSTSPSIVLLDAASGRAVKTIVLRETQKALDVAWQVPDKLLVHARGAETVNAAGKNQALVLSIDLRTQRQEALAVNPARLREPHWLPDGTGILWSERDVGKVRRKLIAAVETKGPVEPRPVPLDGVVSWRSFSPDGRNMIVLQESSLVNRLMRVALDGSEPPVEIAANRPAPIVGVEHRRVEVPTSDGRKAAFVVARVTDPLRRANAVFIRMDGETVGWGGERWAEAQLYLEHGVDFISVERRDADPEANDLTVALDYAHHALAVPCERIAVLGASTAATPVVTVALRHPEKLGIAAVIGLYKTQMLPRTHGTASLRVLGFHGGEDRSVPPEMGRELLEEAFGEEALRPPRGLWHVFPEEPHTLARDESFAAIYATILHELGLAECP